MKESISIEKLIDDLGGRFSSELGIDLSTADSGQIFKWFLASKLFGARISSNLAIRTYLEFENQKVTTTKAIVKTGWDGLVVILDNGGYARYDFSTATKLLAIMEDLERDYGGDLNRLHLEASDEKDLENRLKSLGKGIGDVTVNIFLRELRMSWVKANPKPSPLVELAAHNLGLIRKGEDALKALENIWAAQKVTGKDFCDFEAALLRLAKGYCKKSKCTICPLKMECKCMSTAESCR